MSLPVQSAKRMWMGTVLWAVLATVAMLLYGPTFVLFFRPPEGYGGDFLQDWLSARNFLSGVPVYESLPVSLLRHTGVKLDEFLAWNAHPPVSILLVVPYSYLSYADAHFVWNLTTFPLVFLGAWLVVRGLGKRPTWRWALPTITLGLVCAPLLDQVMYGQFNALLTFLLCAAWAADRNERTALAGLCIGAAAAIKIVPGFLILYCLATRRWRSLVAAAVAFLGLNAVALGFFGFGAFRIYATEAVPQVYEDNAAIWANISVSSFWKRTLGPHANSRVIPLADIPWLAEGLSALSRAVILAVVAIVCVRARSLVARDRAFGAAVVAMTLVAPICWPHYFLLLIVPVGLLLVRLPAGPARWLMWVALVVIWLPQTHIAKFAIGREQAAKMQVNRQAPLTPAENLLVASLQTYALVALLLLTLRLPREDSPASLGGEEAR